MVRFTPILEQHILRQLCLIPIHGVNLIVNDLNSVSDGLNTVALLYSYNKNNHESACIQIPNTPMLPERQCMQKYKSISLENYTSTVSQLKQLAE